MDYIDEMYKKVLASNGRMPANEPEEQRITESEDLAEMPNAFDYPYQYKMKVPQSDIIRENANYAIKERMQDSRDIGQGMRMAYDDRNKYRQQVEDQIYDLKNNPQETYSNPDLDIKIKEAVSSGGGNIPERDFLTEAILNLGPAIGAAFLGESGQLAAPAALQGARAQYEVQRKEQLERAKIARVEAQARIKALMDAKKSGQDAFNDSQKRILDRDKAILSATTDLQKMSSEELRDLNTRLMDVNKEVSKNRLDTATEIAKMERSDEIEKNKIMRAEKSAKAPDVSMPLDQKKMVEKYATEIARMTSINSQVNELKKQVGDKNLSESDRLATAKEQLKLLNSTLGADAVGAEETKRMAAFLEYPPNWIKHSFGPDLDAFYRQLDRVNQRISGTINTQQREIDKIYGRPVKETPATAQEQKQPQNEGRRADIEQWAKENGIDYDTAVKVLKARGDI